MLIYLMFFIYILFDTYILLRLIHWLKGISKAFEKKSAKAVVIIFYIMIASTVILGGLLPHSEIQAILVKLGNYWLGTFLYILMFTVIADLVIFFMKLIHYHKEGLPKLKDLSGWRQRVHRQPYKIQRQWYYVLGIMVAVSSITMSCYGFWHARQITLTKYQASIDKNVSGTQHLRIALIADLHLGYNIGCEKMNQVVTLVNQMEPDVVIVAGDIFDNDYDALDNPEELAEILRGIQSKYGVYAVYGNHDVEERLIGGFSLASKRFAIRDQRMEEFLEQCNFQVLTDQVTTIADGQIQLAGRLDAEKAGDGTDHRLTVTQLLENVNQDQPIIVIDHEPSELEESAAAGVDVLLSGHTHDGQFFPLTLTQKFCWLNSHGMLQLDQMYSFVTSGAGLYGPNMRVGTDSEVMQIDLDFQSE